MHQGPARTIVQILLGGALLLRAAPPAAAQAKAPAAPARAASAPHRYTWKQFELVYPAGWKKDVDADEKGARIVSLVATAAKPKVVLLLSFSPEAPPQDGKFLEAPGLASLAMSYGAVCQAAGAKDKGMLTFNEIQVGDAPAQGSQFTMPTSDGKAYASAHGFTQVRSDGMVIGFLLTSGQVGGVNDDPAYHKAIAEAYAILRTVRSGAK